MVRFKNRYLLFELVWKDGKSDDTGLNEAALLAVFRDSLQQNFGDHGLGSCLASFQVKFFSPLSNLCAVRCGRDEYRQIWCALTLITDIQHRVVLLRLLLVTGAFPVCRLACREYHAAWAAGRRANSQQAKLWEEADAKLQALEM